MDSSSAMKGNSSCVYVVFIVLVVEIFGEDWFREPDFPCSSGFMCVLQSRTEARLACPSILYDPNLCDIFICGIQLVPFKSQHDVRELTDASAPAKGRQGNLSTLFKWLTV